LSTYAHPPVFLWKILIFRRIFISVGDIAMSDLERNSQSAVALVDAPAERRQVKKAPPVTKREPNYHVVIWNDNEHTPEYVIEMLIRVFSHSAAKAYDITWQIDRLGKGIAGTCHRELAELRREQITTYGADYSIADAQRVSMRATLEPVAE
jgi:ATP-dependent Clp protease adaptor protein ClpS